MKRLGIVLLCVLASSVVRADDKAATLADIGWIAGCWEGGEDQQTIREQWMSPLGNAMLGMGHTVSKGKTVAYEFLRIHQETDGIYYTANPSGQAQDSFKLVKWGPKEIIFENPKHDFPQRVIYRLQDDGSLVASIEGNKDGKVQVVD